MSSRRWRHLRKIPYYALSSGTTSGTTKYIPVSREMVASNKKAAFTTEGKSVDFYANGFEVESFVPGGDRMKMSGTSMASPQVANLAAKLLAKNPGLTPPQLVQLIASGSEPSTEDGKIRLIHPARSLSLAAAR